MKQWQSVKTLVNFAYYTDVLEPVWVLALALQKKVDAVNCANSQLKTKSKFCKLEQKPVELYPSIVYLTWNTFRSEIEPSTYIKPHKKEIVLICSTADDNVA